MKKIEKTTNELLYAHVTRVGFDLTLGRTHIAALVYIDHAIRTNHQPYHRGRSIFSNYHTGAVGLISRGLVEHHYTIDKETGRGAKLFRKHYTITTAGKLVISLLKEAGVWEEYAGQIYEKSA